MMARGSKLPSTAPRRGSNESQALISNFTGNLNAAYFVTWPALAARMSNTDRPLIGARGGTLQGIPVITSVYCPAGLIALVDPTGIAIAEGVSEVRTSDKGTLEMVDAAN